MIAAGQLLLTLTGVSLLFACLQSNGAMEAAAQRVLGLSRGRVALLPLVFFVLAALLAMVGPGAILSVALLAPMAMRTGVPVGISPFLIALMIGSWMIQEADKPFISKLLGLAPAFLLGWLLPKQILYRLMKRYKSKLQEALPDTVDLLGIVLGTGLALDQALTRVCEEMQFIYPELSAEFYTVVMQVKAGQDRSKAFQQLVRRTGIEDIKSLAAMIIQSERFGTSLSQALKVYADALRMRRRLRGEKAVGEAGIKMVLATVVFILPVVFIITLVPAMLTMLNNLRGGIGASAR